MEEKILLKQILPIVNKCSRLRDKKRKMYCIRIIIPRSHRLFRLRGNRY